MCTMHLGRGGRGGGTTITLGSARHQSGLGECAHAGRYCDDPCRQEPPPTVVRCTHAELDPEDSQARTLQMHG